MHVYRDPTERRQRPSRPFFALTIWRADSILNRQYIAGTFSAPKISTRIRIRADFYALVFLTVAPGAHC